MQVRKKRAADEEACLALLLDVHRTDGYPRYLPDDLLGFLTPSSESEAWVAEEHGAIVGHVALGLVPWSGVTPRVLLCE